MDQEGNIISPLGHFKLVPRPASASSSAVPRSSLSTTTTMVTSAVTTTSANTAQSACFPLSGNISTCPVSSVPAPAVPQPTATAVTTTTTRCATSVPTAVPTPARQVLRVLDFRSRAKIPAHGLPPCVTGGVLPPRIQQDTETEQIKKNDSAMLDLQTALEDKEITIARLESELATTTHHWEGQITQLRWLDNMVNEKEAELFDKDLAISALESTLYDKSSLISTIISQYKADMMAWQRKFNAMHFHCVNLSQELVKKDEKLYLLKEGDRIQKKLSQQQKELTRSTLSLVKQHKTRFIMGNHSLVSRPNDTSPEVLQEMSLAAARLRAEKAKQERADITKLSRAVDKLAIKYDRYNMITTVNIHNTRCDPDGLPCIVPREMMGLWLFADMEEEPSAEENAMFEFHLQLQVRPPPIYSPTLPKPTVNWSTLNKHKRKNLPDPELFPVHFVPADPTYYTDRNRYKPADQHNNGEDPTKSARIISGKDCGCAKCVPPFGQMYGLLTDMGVIAMPDTSVHGYKWDDVNATWVIATGC